MLRNATAVGGISPQLQEMNFLNKKSSLHVFNATEVPPYNNVKPKVRYPFLGITPVEPSASRSMLHIAGTCTLPRAVEQLGGMHLRIQVTSNPGSSIRDVNVIVLTGP